MIWDSQEWKDELRRDLRRLKRRMREAAKPGSEATSIDVVLERFVFMTAYSVRKLREAQKLSDEFEHGTYQVEAFTRSDPSRPIHHLNWHRIDEHYDLDNGKPKALALGRLCDQLIHSFVFVVGIEDNPWAISGFFFNSDHTKDTTLWWIEWDEFLRLFQGVLADDIVYYRRILMPDGSWRVTKLGPTADPPADELLATGPAALGSGTD